MSRFMLNPRSNLGSKWRCIGADAGCLMAAKLRPAPFETRGRPQPRGRGRPRLSRAAASRPRARRSHSASSAPLLRHAHTSPSFPRRLPAPQHCEHAALPDPRQPEHQAGHTPRAPSTARSLFSRPAPSHLAQRALPAPPHARHASSELVVSGSAGLLGVCAPCVSRRDATKPTQLRAFRTCGRTRASARPAVARRTGGRRCGAARASTTSAAAENAVTDAAPSRNPAAAAATDSSITSCWSPAYRSAAASWRCTGFWRVARASPLLLSSCKGTCGVRACSPSRASCSRCAWASQRSRRSCFCSGNRRRRRARAQAPTHRRSSRMRSMRGGG